MTKFEEFGYESRKKSIFLAGVSHFHVIPETEIIISKSAYFIFYSIISFFIQSFVISLWPDYFRQSLKQFKLAGQVTNKTKYL
jgi:hypothetical protein